MFVICIKMPVTVRVGIQTSWKKEMDKFRLKQGLCLYKIGQSMNITQRKGVLRSGNARELRHIETFEIIEANDDEIKV